MKENDLWPVVVLVGIYFLYRASQTSALLTSQQIASQNQATAQYYASQNSPWITVPGAINEGLAGVGSITNTFANLFSATSTNDSTLNY